MRSKSKWNYTKKSNTKEGSDERIKKHQRYKKANSKMARANPGQHHHQLNEHEFEQIPGDSGGQRSLERCSPWGCKESNTAQ